MLGGAACGGSEGAGKVTLTFWSWVPDIEKEIKLFEESHPDIKIKYVNAGQGTPQYTKLRTALKSGTGAPDVVQIEFQYIPTFRQIDALADISQNGASGVENDFVDWTWGQVSEGSKVYAIPQDSGPMGLLYRKDIFDEYGLKVPKTWEEFAQEANKLHEANPEIYMTDFPPNDGGWFTGLLWQAGSRPFKGSGDELTININDSAAMKVAEYWQELFDAGAVDMAPDFNNEWYSALDRGKYALWISAAWGPVFLSGVAERSKGKWRAALLPQWNAGDKISANWVGRLDQRGDKPDRIPRGSYRVRDLAQPQLEVRQDARRREFPLPDAQEFAGKLRISEQDRSVLWRAGGQPSLCRVRRAG